MGNELTSSDILTPEQLASHIKVYAGPGAGKTHFLVENIKNIITCNPLISNSTTRKVLCITYTNAAVEELRRRLERYLDCIEIYTIHGFIIEHIIKPFQQDLIGIMKEDFNITISSKGKITSQIEGLGILHGIDKNEIYQFIRDTNPEIFATESFEYSKKIMGEVEVDNDAFLHSLSSEDGRKVQFKHSSKIKAEHVPPLKTYIWSKVRKLTHNEILYFGYRIIERNPTALYALRVQFPYIFVDEFQDTNPLQTLLIKKIGEKSCIIGVVGDVAQSIYSFQNAKPSDFTNFKIEGQRNAEYTIKGNRRSTENIINFCNFLRQNDTHVVQTSARSYKDGEGEDIESKKIHFLIGDSPEIRDIIKTTISSGGVVLTRTWAAAFDYIQDIAPEQALLLKSIYNNYYTSPIQLRDEIVGHNNVTWVRAFRFIFNLWNSYTTGSFIDILSALKLVSNIDLSQISPKIIFQLDALAAEVFCDISDEKRTCDIITKLNEDIKQPSYSELLSFIGGTDFTVPIFDEQERESLKTSVEQLQWDTSYKLFTEVFSEKSVYMTVHQAKGLEWEKVVVSVTPGKRDGITLDKLYQSPHITEETLADEFVRMYYVACSRAQNDLYIHIASGCTREQIDSSLSQFIQVSGLEIEYEFL